MEDEQSRFENKMENLEKPQVNVSRHQQDFRLTLLSTRKTAWAGFILLLLPILFLAGVVLKHYWQIDLVPITSLYEWIGEVDQKYGDDSWLNWAIRGLLFFGPLLAVFLNLLAVTHIHYERPSRELVVAFRMRWLNWSIIIACGLIFAIFLFYLIIENLACIN